MIPPDSEGGVSRRRFLKQAGLSVAGLTVATGVLAAPSPEILTRFFQVQRRSVKK